MSESLPRFYVTGGSLAAGSPSYIERRSDRELLEGLLEGRFCYVLETRQVGKSSLMVRTAERLRMEGRAVVLLDLTGAGTNVTVEQWYGGLLSTMASQLRREDEADAMWAAGGNQGPAQRWFTALGQLAASLPGGLVVFIDEIDTVQSLPFPADEFFAGIRQCYNRRAYDHDYNRISFCLLGVATPSDLIRQQRVTPFNIGTRIELSDFALEEAAPLAAPLVERGLDPAQASRVLERVLYWTGGHPYLTQTLCQLAATRGATGAGDVDDICAGKFLHKTAHSADDNLSFVRARLLEHGQTAAETAAVLDTYARVVADRTPVPYRAADPVGSVLLLSGIARVVDGHLVVRNRIYQRVFNMQWVRANLPGAELARQRTAARRGFLRASAIAAALLLMGAIALVQTMASLRTSARMLAMNADSLARSPGQEMEAAKALQSALLAGRSSWSGILPQITEAATRLATAPWRVRTLRMEPEVVSVRFLVDGRLVGASMDGAVSIGRPDHWQAAWTVTNKAGAVFDAMAEGDQVSIFSANARVLDYRIGSDRVLREWGGSGQQALAGWMAGGQACVLATTGTDARVMLVRRGRPGWLDLVGHTQPAAAASFGPGGRFVVTASPDGTVRQWDGVTGKSLHVNSGGRVEPTCAAIGPLGKAAIIGDAGGSASVFDPATGLNLAGSRADAGPVTAVALTAHAGLFATAHRSGVVYLWPGKPGDIPLAALHCASTPRSVSISPAGDTVAVGLATGGIEIWRFPVPFQPEETDPPAMTDPPGEITATSPDGRLKAVARADGFVTVRGPEGKVSLQLHHEPIWDLRFSADSRWILTRSQDRTRRRCPATFQEAMRLVNRVTGSRT